MKKRRQLKRRALHQILNPKSASIEKTAKVLLFGNRNFQVCDELFEQIIISHISDFYYN